MKSNFFSTLIFLILCASVVPSSAELSTIPLALTTSHPALNAKWGTIPFELRYGSDELNAALKDAFVKTTQAAAPEIMNTLKSELWGTMKPTVYIMGAIGAIIFTYMIYQVWSSYKMRVLQERTNKLLEAQASKGNRKKAMRRSASTPFLSGSRNLHVNLGQIS